jgi:hypothetical protein
VAAPEAGTGACAARSGARRGGGGAGRRACACGRGVGASRGGGRARRPRSHRRRRGTATAASPLWRGCCSSSLVLRSSAAAANSAPSLLVSVPLRGPVLLPTRASIRELKGVVAGTQRQLAPVLHLGTRREEEGPARRQDRRVGVWAPVASR